MQLGWDPIWFGVVMTINMEMALITPPVGLNLFVVYWPLLWPDPFVPGQQGGRITGYDMKIH